MNPVSQAQVAEEVAYDEAQAQAAVKIQAIQRGRKTRADPRGPKGLGGGGEDQFDPTTADYVPEQPYEDGHNKVPPLAGFRW